MNHIACCPVWPDHAEFRSWCDKSVTRNWALTAPSCTCVVVETTTILRDGMLTDIAMILENMRAYGMNLNNFEERYADARVRITTVKVLRV